MANNMNRRSDIESVEQKHDIVSHIRLGKARRGFSRGAGAAVVRSEDAVASGGEGGNDMAVLVRGLGEAVEENDNTFLKFSLGRWAVDVGEAEGGVVWEEDDALFPSGGSGHFRLGEEFWYPSDNFWWESAGVVVGEIGSTSAQCVDCV